MFDWLKIKSTLADARNECKNMRATIDKNKLRIEELRKLPLPKEELAALASKWIDDFGGDYPQMLQAELKQYVANPMDSPRLQHARYSESSMSPLRIMAATASRMEQSTDKTIERALFYMLGDQLKEGVRRAVQDMEYPTIVGPAMPKRLAEIDKLTKENAELEAKVKEIELDLQESADVCTPAKEPAQKHRARGEIEYLNTHKN